MNSIEALENIAITFDEGGYEPTTLGAKSGSFKEVFGIEFNIIEQDLKCLRQKQLEEKNKELKEKINKLNKELVIEREVGGMTSKESLRNLKQEILTPNYLTDYEKDECIDVIQQDLERLEKLEENYYSLNVACEEIEFENVRLEKENKKLKQVIEILKDRLVLDIETEIAKENDIELIGYWLVEGDTQKLYTIITKKEYELLKEVFGNES